MDLNRPGHASAIRSTPDEPNFSPFPKLTDPPLNVPPSDEESEQTLENARTSVLNSNDPEMQLVWAADALVHCGVSATYEERLALAKPHAARSSTPRIEHQLKIDAMNIVTFLADQHHPKAEFLRGMWLEWGRFGQREDKKEAFRCYSRASDRGYARADYRIGMLYESYNDPIKALRHYHRGVEAGDAASCYRLGMMTLRGQHGQQQDFAKGIDLIKRSAADADENAAQGAYVYGMLLARELPQIQIPDGLLPHDDRQAKINIEKAAYLKFAKAQVKMGSAYELGALGCEFNPALSVHYSALASKQGEAEADMALSKWFLVGSEGLFPKNEELAYTYAERAAQSELPTAEFALGYFHEIGMHASVDLDTALEWYHKAFKHGNEDAGARIDALSRKQVLSKRDHENVAVQRIKSQYGSRRQQRPDKFKTSHHRPGPGTVEPPVPQGYGPSVSAHAAGPEHRGTFGRPLPRPMNTTPYPEHDAVTPVPHQPRPSSIPYPIQDGLPRPRTGPGSSPYANAGPHYQAPTRPATTVNARPSSAFQVTLDLRAGSVGPQPPYAGQQKQPPYHRTPPMQTHDPRHGAPAWGRNASGPPAMQGHLPPHQQNRPLPPTHNMSSASAPGSHLSPRTSPINVGYSAPAEDHRRRPGGPALKPSSSNPNFHPAPQSPSRRTASPSSGRTHAPEGRRPVTLTDEGPAKPAVPQKETSKPAAAPAKPPGKGPKTFDEMGVPAQSKDGECVSLHLLLHPEMGASETSSTDSLRRPSCDSGRRNGAGHVGLLMYVLEHKRLGVGYGHMHRRNTAGVGQSG